MTEIRETLRLEDINKHGMKRRICGRGYVMVIKHGHHRANRDGYVYEHILVMEKFLKKKICVHQPIHHIDNNKRNNYIGNLILFDSHKDHNIYEANTRAFKECGHYNWIKCCYCGKYDSDENLKRYTKKRIAWHHQCRLDYQKKYRTRKRNGRD